jgi:hypothetical protein
LFNRSRFEKKNEASSRAASIMGRLVRGKGGVMEKANGMVYEFMKKTTPAAGFAR